MAQFESQVAIITGAASGIGKQIAIRFAQEGGIPVIADLNLDAARATADELIHQGGLAMPLAMDVSDESSVERGVAAAYERFQRIDVLVSNAGIQIVKRIEEFSLAEWKRMLSIHLDGAFLTTKACLRHMYQARRGSIIYMGSVHSKEASLLKAAYVTAKHGLIGLCKVVAREGAQFNVRANVVCPGFVSIARPSARLEIPATCRGSQASSHCHSDHASHGSSCQDAARVSSDRNSTSREN